MAHHHYNHASHPHEHAGHSHLHGVIDPTIAITAHGIWAIQWSCAGLVVTAGLQLVVVALSGRVALLADTIHNFGDAAMALPLWMAFLLARRRPTERFTCDVSVHVDPLDQPGAEHHRIAAHAHDGLPSHSHA